MSKYSTSFKQSVVEFYGNGERSVRETARRPVFKLVKDMLDKALNRLDGECQAFCAGGHDDEKERIIPWLSKKNFWTDFLLDVARPRLSARTACRTT